MSKSYINCKGKGAVTFLDTEYMKKTRKNYDRLKFNRYVILVAMLIMLISFIYHAYSGNRILAFLVLSVIVVDVYILLWMSKVMRKIRKDFKVK